jgi:hypothetical protein
MIHQYIEPQWPICNGMEKNSLTLWSMDRLFYLQLLNMIKIGIITYQEFYSVIDVVFEQA